MERIEDFMREYFKGRTEMKRAFGRLQARLAERFLASGHTSWHEESARTGERETILDIQVSEGGVEVFTRGWLTRDHRVRYQVSALEDSWRIRTIAIECGICHGAGKHKDEQKDCRFCKGYGWVRVGKANGT